MLEWLVLDKLDWLYLHISSGRNGAFLFGFTTMAELILLFCLGNTWSWWAECFDVSKSKDFIKKSESEPAGVLQIRKTGLLRVWGRSLLLAQVWACVCSGWYPCV